MRAKPVAATILAPLTAIRLAPLAAIRLGPLTAIPNLGRTAFDDVADIDLRARQTHPAFDYIGQQLPGTADERFATRVLVGAGTLADKHQFGVRMANAKNEIGAQRSELAALTVAD